MTQDAVSGNGRARSSWYPWRHTDHHEHPALQAVHDSRTVGERVADQIASFGGSWTFISMFLGLILTWMVVNALFLQRLLHHRAFDPFPFIALNLILSALAGLQAPIIMMSQNRAAARDEILAHHHYEETQKIDDLLRSNTDFTTQVRDLAQKIHNLTEKRQHATPRLIARQVAASTLGWPPRIKPGISSRNAARRSS